MKTHFGFMEEWGDYESPMSGCEETLCGCTGEEVCENATDDWDCVSCKKCLRLKDRYKEEERRNEEVIVQQMGDMADFMEEERKKEKANDISRTG